MEMATLDDLLSNDGFRRGRGKPRRGIAGTSATSLSSSRLGSSGSKVRPARTRSDVNPLRSLSVVLEKAGFKQSIANNGAGKKFRSVDWNEEQASKLQDRKGRAFPSLNEYKKIDGRAGKSRRSVSSMATSNVSYKSSMVVESKGGYSYEQQTKLRYNRSLKNNLYENDQPKSTKTQNSLAKPSFKDAGVGRPVPALDSAALTTITSMINSCVNQILEDKSFRSSLHQACVSSLKSNWVQYRKSKENRVISVLVGAIKSVERIITEGPNQSELKKAFLRLNAITRMKSMELDDGHTCGIPNSYLAACGHLYLSILYKILRKDKVSAVHLLRVFCDSPYHARTTLLPELWDRLFLPNLSHLKVWHEKEASSIPATSGVKKKLEFLEKVYNDVVDMVTSQFAAYYKGWLMGENDGSALPNIHIPLASVPDIAEDTNEAASFNSCNLVPSKTMISKRQYFVFSQAKRNETTDDMESREEEENDEVGDETEERQADSWRRKCDDHIEKDDEDQSRPTELGTYETEYFQEYYDACSQQSDSSVEITPENDQIKENHCCSSSSGFPEAEEMKHGSKKVQFSDDNKGHIDVRKCDPEENESGLKLKKLAEATCHLQLADHANDANSHSPKLSVDSLVCNSEQDEMIEVTRTKLVMDESDTTNVVFDSCSLKERFRIPKEFICPLTGQLFKEPVTLESGHTFELAAIKDRFNQGNRTCPVTGKILKRSLIPDTNMVLKHVINEWVAKCFRTSISLASQSTFSSLEPVCNYKIDLSFLIIDQILTGFSFKEGKENIEHLISLGGLQFLTKVLEVGSLEEKSRAAELLIKCIRADGCCRNHLALQISKSSLLSLIHSKQVHARTCAASLLIELICLHRRMDITSFVSGLKTEAIDSTKRELLLCLESSLPEEKVLVAVLLLHLDLMEESRMMPSVYKEEAVKCIVKALECCLFNKMFIPNCRRALLMLGGHFSISGEIITETWLLKKAGYHFRTYNDDDVQTTSKEESRMEEDWLKSMALILLHYGKKSFLQTLSKCWKFGDPELVRVCVVTAAWLSHALASFSVPAVQLSAFSAFMPRLKECLTVDMDVEVKVLASLSLLNFSKISECRIPLITFADEIHDPLKSLKEVTWTAKHLYNDIFDEAS